MLYVLIATIILFFVGLLLRKIFKNLCALCFAVAGAWLLLLFFKPDPPALAIYMGGSAVGLMYYIFSKLPDRFAIFKMPFLISLFFIVHLFLGFGSDSKSAAVLLALWAVFAAIFIFRDPDDLKSLTKRIMDCCRNW